VADSQNNAIRKITSAGVVSTLVGGPASTVLSRPYDMCIDDVGFLYVLDSISLLQIDVRTAAVNIISPSNVLLDYYYSGIAIDALGSLYATQYHYASTRTNPAYTDAQGTIDEIQYNIDKWNSNIDSVLRQEIEGVPFYPYQVSNTYTISSYSDRVAYFRTFLDAYRADMIAARAVQAAISPTISTIYHTVVTISQTGTVSTLVGGAAGNVDGVGAEAALNNPAGICIDNNMNIYVADSSNKSIRAITVIQCEPSIIQNVFQSSDCPTIQSQITALIGQLKGYSVNNNVVNMGATRSSLCSMNQYYIETGCNPTNSLAVPIPAMQPITPPANAIKGTIAVNSSTITCSVTPNVSKGDRIYLGTYPLNFIGPFTIIAVSGTTLTTSLPYVGTTALNSVPIYWSPLLGMGGAPIQRQNTKNIVIANAYRNYRYLLLTDADLNFPAGLGKGDLMYIGNAARVTGPYLVGDKPKVDRILFGTYIGTGRETLTQNGSFGEIDIPNAAIYTGLYPASPTVLTSALSYTATITCPQGNFSYNGACFMAPPGVYAAGGVPFYSFTSGLCGIGLYNATTGAISEGNCARCPTGKFSRQGASTCAYCLPGNYCPDGVLTACSVGTYNDMSGSDVIAACKSCSVGTYNDVPGMNYCKKCNAGTYGIATGSDSPSGCIACPVGTFSSPGAAVCTSCSAADYLFGAVIVLAGSGNANNVDGTGIYASFNSPTGIVYESTTAQLYITDTANKNVRKVTLAGVVTTLVQTGYNNPTGITRSPSTGYMYVIDDHTQYGTTKAGKSYTREKSSGAAGDFNKFTGFFAGLAGVNNQAAITETVNTTFTCVHGSNNGMSDTKIIKWFSPPSTTNDLSKVLGQEVCTVYQYSENGTYYTLNTNSSDQYFYGMYSPYTDTTGHIGPSYLTSADTYYNAQDMTFSSVGNLYIADTGNNRINTYDLTNAGTMLNTYTDGGSLVSPWGLVLFGTTLYIVDSGNHSIAYRSTTSTDTGITFLCGGRGTAGFTDGTGAAARFSTPTFMTVDDVGKYLYVSDTGNKAIRRVEIATGIVITVCGGPTLSTFNRLAGLAFQNTSSPAYVTNTGQGQAGYLYVVDSGTHQIKKVTVSCGITDG
jgi:hypothetical protein